MTNASKVAGEVSVLKARRIARSALKTPAPGHGRATRQAPLNHKDDSVSRPALLSLYRGREILKTEIGIAKLVVGTRHSLVAATSRYE